MERRIRIVLANELDIIGLEYKYFIRKHDDHIVENYAGRKRKNGTIEKLVRDKFLSKYAQGVQLRNSKLEDKN